MFDFHAEIKKHEGIDGAYVEIPFDVEKAFGARRVKVKAFFDNMEYRGSIIRMGGCYMLGLTQQIRKTINKQPGDIIRVQLEKDLEERVVEIPEDFRQALASNPSAEAFFARLSFSHKREYLQWITGAKKAETRASRIEKAIAMLMDGKSLK